MTRYEILTLVISGIAALIAFFSWKTSRKTIQQNQETIKQSRAVLLQETKNSIDNAKRHLESLTLSIAPLSAKTNRNTEDEKVYKIFMQTHRGAIENVFNCYDAGCQHYYADEVDKSEFKKRYSEDIRQYITSFKEDFSEPQSPFTYMIKAYKEWHHPA